MAKVRRFSGDLKIELSFDDRANRYRVRLCPVRVPLWQGKPQARCETVFVKPPRHLTRAVDAPSEFDSVARAAISFARPETQQYAAPDRAMTTWGISRGARSAGRYAKGHPKRRR